MARKNIRIVGRKALSLLLTFTLVTSLLQVSTFAAGTAEDPYDIGDTAVTLNAETQPEGAIVEDGVWTFVEMIPAVYAEEATCEMEEHTEHTAECYQQTCTIEEHSHGEECCPRKSTPTTGLAGTAAMTKAD